MVLESKMQMHYVHIIHSNSDQFYIGYSSELRARIKAHNEDKTKSTRGRKWELVYYEAYLDEQSARHREDVKT